MFLKRNEMGESRNRKFTTDDKGNNFDNIGVAVGSRARLTQPSPVYIAQMLPTSFPFLDNFSST